MNIQLEVRPATAADVPGMAAVKAHTWPEEDLLQGQLEKVLGDAAHSVFVAAAQGNVVGFVDGFITHSAQGVRRWEVDLLAVHSDWRGKKLGQRMIDACLKAGRTRSAAFARALIQVENRASQISFARCGFQPQAEVFSLYVAQPEAVPFPSGNTAGHILNVHTINYSGVWLEEDHSEASLQALRAACWQQKLDLAGTLVIQGKLSDNGKMDRAGFKKIADYQWWMLPFLGSAAEFL